MELNVGANNVYTKINLRLKNKSPEKQILTCPSGLP